MVFAVVEAKAIASVTNDEGSAKIEDTSDKSPEAATVQEVIVRTSTEAFP